MTYGQAGLDRPVRWGFLGAGYVASRALAPAVHAANGAVLYAASARDPSRAAALAPAGPVYGGYADLLADPQVQAVYVSLANDQHVPWAVAALGAGKHVLCEKPMGTTLPEVLHVAAAARAAGLLLAEAAWWLWHPRTRRLRAIMREHEIGPARQVRAGFTFSGVPAGNYRLDPARGGGALLDVGWYPVVAALEAYGWELPGAVSASSRVGPTGVDLGTTVELAFHAGTARLVASIDGDDAQWLDIDAESGSLALSAPAFTAWREDATEITGTLPERFGPCDPYRLMVESVSTCVRSWAGQGPALAERELLPVWASVMVAAVLQAARDSARRDGEPVDPAALPRAR